MRGGKKIVVSFVVVMMLTGRGMLNAQQVARKHISDKHQAYYDSLKTMNYDRVFPLLGSKVYKKGFDIPFPIGVMINNFYGSQDVIIDNIHVGVQGPDTTLGPADFSNVIEFGRVNAKAYNLNTRVDLYIFPFLNVYGLFAYLPYASTEVNLVKPVQLTSKPKQHGTAAGFGIMGAGGVGPVWIQADFNITWADMQLLDNKVVTKVSGIRMGHVFPSRQDAEKNFSVWIGAMGIFLNNRTVGKISMADVFTDIPQSKIDEIKNSYDSWYNGLNPVAQKVADKIVEKLQDKIDGIDVKDTYITYEMDKALKSKWAGLVGAQYQFSKKWQLRAESNFIGGDRFSLLLSVNYRFLGFKKPVK